MIPISLPVNTCHPRSDPIPPSLSSRNISKYTKRDITHLYANTHVRLIGNRLIDLHPFRHSHSVCVGIVSDDERAILSIRISNSNIQGLAIQHLMPWG